LFQIAREDVEIGGVPVPAGAMLMTLYAAANRDPRHFENPEVFDIHRANARTHLSFGQGIHFCVGSPFARAEGKLGFQAFFERIKDVRFADDRNDFERTVSYVLRGIRELHLTFTPA
jgi:cytochrome P450